MTARPMGRRPGRLAAFLRQWPIHVVSIAIAAVWLVPSLGVVVTSFRPRSDIASSGWWT